MKIARVVAQWRKNARRESAYTFCIVCGLDENLLVADGEWMGYIKDSDTFWPFILKRGNTCFYGTDDPKHEKTTFGSQKIVVGEFFTVSSWEPANGPYTYEIVSCHFYD